MTDTPADRARDFFQQSLDHAWGINGLARDDAKAAHYARLGHEAGDLNCTYLLCTACEDGVGQPRDYERMLELARQMLDRGFAAGNLFLAEAYAAGLGAPLDKVRAAACAAHVVEALSRPVPGVREEVRLEALALASDTDKSLVDADFKEKTIRELLRVSSAPYRYAVLAATLMPKLAADGCDPALREEIRDLLDAGCRAGDRLACWVKGALLFTGGHQLYERDVEKAVALLRRSAESGQHEANFCLARSLENADEAATALARFWHGCRWGMSLTPRQDELPCAVSLRENRFSCGWDVLERREFRAVCDAGREAALCHVFQPHLVLENESDEAIEGAEVRLCSPDAGLDVTKPLADPIVPGEEYVIDLEDAIDNLGDELYVRVTAKGRYTEIVLNAFPTVDLFRAVPPPVRLWWERSFFGGCVPWIQCLADTPLTDVSMELRDGSRLRVDLPPDGSPARLGWMSLGKGDTFLLCCAEHAPVVCAIRPRRGE